MSGTTATTGPEGDKNLAQLDLASNGFKLGLYRHYKGGYYVAYSVSLDEECLEPLVHYYSCERKTRWTRTMRRFEASRLVGNARFLFVRSCAWQELAKAAGLDALLEGLQHLAAGQRFLDDVLVELPPPHEKAAERTG